jgi:filamentous hemagglutinin
VHVSAPPDNPSAYSVAFETKLDPADFGKSRDIHFNRSNAALDSALKTDPRFAKIMDDLIPNVQSSVSSVGGRATPPGWTWEHASSSTAFGQEGVMRLVPSTQHTPGSPWWRILHPDVGASGGYSEWAIPRGAPKN